MTRSNVRLENFRNAFISLQLDLAGREPAAYDYLVKDGGLRSLVKQYVEIQRHIVAHYPELFEKIEADYKALNPQEETPPAAAVADTPAPEAAVAEEDKENLPPPTTTPTVDQELVGID